MESGRSLSTLVEDSGRRRGTRPNGEMARERRRSQSTCSSALRGAVGKQAEDEEEGVM